MKLISILTPTHNRSKDYLIQTIESVQNQLEDGFTHEHIIVDNKSTDGTKKLVQAMAKKDKRIKYIYNPRNLGAADALNIAFKKSRGELIVPVDDDDLLPRSGLQFRYNFFKNNPKVKWAYGHIAYIDDKNRLMKNLAELSPTPVFKKNYLYSLLLKNFIPGGSVSFKRECIKKVCGWNPELVTQDFDLTLKLAHAGYIPHKMDSYLYYYRRHPKQAHKEQIKAGIYAKEWKHYLKLYNVTEEFLHKL